MKRIVWLGAFTLSFLVLLPNQSRAWDNIKPQYAHGFGWLKAKAYNSAPWIHAHGPLYNYGPYDMGQGYNWMYFNQPHHGVYQPAYDFSNYGVGAAAPVEYAPAPAHAQVQPQQPTVAPANYYPSYFAPARPSRR